jgi:D-serine deaminase-like pyridoxal phosphate-dependent protein
VKTIYDLDDPSKIISPALCYYIEGIRANICRAVAMAGDPARLWPHVKSHKCAEVVKMQQAAGINRFKCATIAEAEMLGICGAAEILLAYPLVGPNIERFIKLMKTFPDSGWWATGDNVELFAALNESAGAVGMRPNILLDVNVGMERTGILLQEIDGIVTEFARFKNLQLRGFHCYDGQIKDKDLDNRRKNCKDAVEILVDLIGQLDYDTIILGGSPTFPCHLAYEGVFLSPGTVFVHDHGYKTAYPDLPFEPAAAIMARVISLPGTGLFTLDLGYKAIAADPPGERGIIASLPDAITRAHSEEHWVWEMAPSHPDFPRLGQIVYIIPTHICPTTALYPEVLAIKNGEVADVWKVTARDRKITI